MLHPLSDSRPVSYLHTLLLNGLNNAELVAVMNTCTGQ